LTGTEVELGLFSLSLLSLFLSLCSYDRRNEIRKFLSKTFTKSSSRLVGFFSNMRAG
jgi:hypothetical protein